MTTKPAAEASPVVARDDRVRYDGFAMALHWTTAAVVLVQFLLAEFWGFADRPARHLMIVAHMSFGMLLALVIAIRILWRLLPGHRVKDAMTGVMETASKAMHILLYMLLAAQTVLGFVLRWSGGEAMSFFGLMISPPFESFSKPAHQMIGTAHDWVGWTIMVLAAAHAAAAIFHHRVLKDDILWRMLPGVRARHAEARALDARLPAREAQTGRSGRRAPTAADRVS